MPPLLLVFWWLLLFFMLLLLLLLVVVVVVVVVSLSQSYTIAQRAPPRPRTPPRTHARIPASWQEKKIEHLTCEMDD